MSFLCTRIHYIWSTARREPFIQAPWRPRLHGYMRGIDENLKSKIFIVGGVEDHVHVYCSMPPTISIAELASAVKSNSSRWVRESIDQGFGWQDGYAAFTMSRSADDDVIGYIMAQETHHHKQTFQEELMTFLRKFEVPFDSRYVFD